MNSDLFINEQIHAFFLLPYQFRLHHLLTLTGLRPVTFTDWNRLDKFEVEAGTKLGKPREKVTNVQKMLDITYD